MSRMNLSAMMKRVQKTIHHYRMILPGEHIAIGSSGGKDSTLLIYIMNELRKTMRFGFSMTAVRVIDSGSPCHSPDTAVIFQEWCLSLDLDFKTITPAKPPSPGLWANPCFLCARRRRESLFREMESSGLTVLALGHTATDAAVTALMNLTHHGRLETMPPVMNFFQDRFRLIRPMIQIDENTVCRIHSRLRLPEPPPPCPAGTGKTRHLMQSWLRAVQSENRQAGVNILRAAGYWAPVISDRSGTEARQEEFPRDK